MDNFELNESDLNIETTPDNSAGESQPSPELFKYTAAGKEIEEDRDTVLKRASMGYDYAQKMQSFKQERSTFEQQMAEREAKIRDSENRWSAYDTYSKENPDWAEHVRQSWENRNSFGQSTDSTQMQGLTPELQREMSELRQFKDEFKGFMDSQKREREDAFLNESIDSTRKEYPDIDFSYSDPETGKTLEYKVLEHMQAHGLNNFRAAFRDFYHDQLLARAVTKAKEDTGKQLQERQQKGYITESDTPIGGIQQATNLKNKSYFELVEEGYNELGNY